MDDHAADRARRARVERRSRITSRTKKPIASLTSFGRACLQSRPLIAGTGRESTRATIAATRRAAAAGVDAVLVRTPSFFKPQMTTDAFVRHFTEVADASPVPVLLYNVTLYTGVNLLPDAVERLAVHPNIVGIKESGSDIGQIAEYVARTPDDFTVLAGSATTLVHALCAGCDGAILALASLAPAECVSLAMLVRETASRRGPCAAAPADAAGALGGLDLRRAGPQSRTRIDWLCRRGTAAAAASGRARRSLTSFAASWTHCRSRRRQPLRGVEPRNR